MASELLGRTNQAFPPVWWRLATSAISTAEELVQCALGAQTVIDISTNPALWGGHMRGTEALLMAKGGLEIERAPDEKTAGDLVQAHLIQVLSAIGREWIDFYFLQVRRGLEEYQINGALQALSSAKDEGHVRFIGLASEGPALAVMGVWQFHDAFEVLLLSEEDEALISLARQRRVGIVVQGEQPSSVGQCSLLPAEGLCGAAR